ncbi:TIM-barrel domain-containing protein [Frateuria sp. YIM B11624]|uniref:TIM-barrel domain-containing protein n=1 Tax=Frateuria sp. YIM B11624 TaxID=3143185 RepID=UPI003C77D3EE
MAVPPSGPSLSRRDFIRSVSLFGLSVAFSSPAKALRPSGGKFTTGNGFLVVSFDTGSGTFDVHRRDGRPLLVGATSCVNFATGPIGPAGARRRVSDGGFHYAAQIQAFTDRLGRGVRLTIRCTDSRRLADVEIHLSLYENLQALTCEAICTNTSQGDVSIHSLEPVRAAVNEGGVLYADDVSKCLTNGEMYFDAGAVHTFGSKEGAISSGHLKGVDLANGPFAGASETIHSWWNAGLFSGHGREGIALGYLENTLSLGNLLIARTGKDEISFVAESVYAPTITLRSGHSVRSNRFMIEIAESPYQALEHYAAAVGKANDARTHSILNGWCSWFYTLSFVSQDEVVANAAFAAEHLKPYGLQYIQVDEGYQRWHGEWEGNERFPNGMKWLADRIKGFGFKAGIWISPYVVEEPTKLFREHPDWLLKRRDGSLQRIGNWPEGAAPPADENPKKYALDITHPGAAKWLHDLVDTIVNDWGYEMIKIDFVAWSLLAAERYHDPTMSAAGAYRKGMQIMRQAAGDRCHILDCGPGAITTGLIDSMRIEVDVNYGFHEAAWATYFTHPAGSASAMAKRYYFHGKTWVNDADHLCMDLLTDAQSEAAATLIAMSGGNLFSGDRLTQLDPSKLEILKKITPSLGEAAVPVDLFDHDMQYAFAMTVERPFGHWTLFAVFNPSLTDAVTRIFRLDRLGLVPGRRYIAYDFWKQQLAGDVHGGELAVTVQPGSVTLLALHERSGKPQFASTDRHVSQGALELKQLQWDERTKTLSGTSTGPLHSAHQVFVYVPDALDWTWDGSALFRDHGPYSLKLVDPHLIRVHVRFDASDEVRWEVRYAEFLA